MEVVSERRRIRTFDRLLRRQVLYPAELCTHFCFETKNVKVFVVVSLENYREKHFVGVAGFEPAASCSQSRRDNRATLHPENNL
jgi:hypothetical protein